MKQDKDHQESNVIELTNVLNNTELMANENGWRLKNLESKIKYYEESLMQLQLKVTDLNAKTQATADFSDDLVTSSSTLIESVEARVDKTLEMTDQVLTNADALISTYLVIISIVVAVVGTAGSLWIQHRLAKTREEHLRDAVQDLTKKLRNERDFRESFIHSLVTHRSLSENINTAIDNAVKEKVDTLDISGIGNEKGNFKDDLDTLGG
ncbi:hypothetical protein AB9R81_00035 [Vibrio cyclitrophicus]